MADKVSRLAPTGNMDKDSDVRYVGKGERKGDYIDARNIQIAQDSGGSAGDAVPTLGTQFGFNLGEVQAQSKKYKVTVDGDATKSHSITFLSTKRDYRITTGTGPNGEIEFNGTVASLISAFQASNLASAFLVQQNGNEVTFTLNPYPYYQWYLDNNGVDDVSVVCVQEAIPTNLAGPLKDIGSYDLLGDLFVFSTSQDNLPTESSLVVNNVTLGGPLTVVTFTSDHGFALGNWIRITNSEAPWLNGIFLVQGIPSSTQVQIVTDSAWGATHAPFTVGSETVTINPTGIGEIGVAQKDNNSETWTYVRLLRSVELNLVSKKAIRCDAREKGLRKIIYYTDKYNRPRHFSYGGEYVEDGALTFVNSQNLYLYDFISYEALLFSNSAAAFDTKINYLGQSDSGGGLSNGNKYYVFRFSDSQDSKTNWSNPTRAVSVFPKSLSDDPPLTIKGGSSSDPVTTKAVNLQLLNIPEGIYDSVEFGVLESSETGGLSGTIFRTINLNSQDSQLTFQHTGIEEEQEFLDVGEISISLNTFSSIETVGDLAIIDKRLVGGNVTYSSIADLSEFAQTFKHQLKYRNIDGINILNNETLGGYTQPENVFQYPSLVLNETYAVGCDFIFTDGSESATFLIDTIKIDTSPTNTANPTDNRRVANGGLPNYALNVNDNTVSINVPYITFSNIDMNFLVNGVPLKDIVSSIRFRFAEIKKEILASGFVIMGVSGSKTIGPVRIDSPNVINQIIEGDGTDHFQYLDWNGDYDIATTTNSQTIQTRLNGTRFVYPNSYTAQRKTAFFYSPDISMGGLDDYQPQAADKINILYPIKRRIVYTTLPDVNYNQSRIMGNQTFSGTGDRMLPSSIAEMIADPVSTASQNSLANSDGVNQYDILDARIMESGQSAIVGNETLDTYNKESSQGGSGKFQYNFETAHSKCLAIRSDSDMFPYSSAYWDSEGVDYGVYYAQLVRPNPNKYADVEAIEYQPYNQSFSSLEILNVQSELDVFGGDAFITKTLLRNRFSKVEQVDDPEFTPGGIDTVLDVGRHLGMSYFAQTYMNMELVSVPNPDEYISFPESFTGNNVEKLREWTDYTGGEYIQFYNSRYSYGLKSLLRAAYSEALNEDLKDVPTRIIYSSRDIYSSKEDSMRLFLPLNIHDLDGTFGPIEVVANVTGNLFAIQNRKFEIEAFNARGQLQSDINSVEILLKSGDVFSQDGKTLSSYGTQHKWSCIKGYNVNGKDVLYWFNAENGLMMRFGEDGTRVISDRGMIAFFSNFTKWVKDKHEHAFEQGVRGVWDDRRKEAIWTFTGWRNIPQWTNSGVIPVQTLAGTVIANSNAPADTYEEFPRFFRCTVAHTASSATEPGVGADWEDFWEQILYTDYNYYSIFTICFNEQTNGFRCFYGHIPKTYLRWQNSFLSSHPVHRNLIFEHRLGEPTTWYGVDGLIVGNIAPKIEDATVEMVVNELPEQSIRGVAVEYLTERAPDRIDYSTSRQRTYDEAAQFEQRDDQWFAPIRNDITDTGDPEGDGAVLSGDYLRVKFTIFGGTYNLLHSIVVKIRDRFRRFNR